MSSKFTPLGQCEGAPKVGTLFARSALILALVLAPISQVYAQLVTRVIDGDTLVVQG